MNDIVSYLPLLNLLIIPLFLAYVKNEVRLSRLEHLAHRVENHPCFTDRRHAGHQPDHT